MENNGDGKTKKWGFKGNEMLTKPPGTTIRGVLNMVMDSLNPDDPREILRLGHGDPSQFPSFHTSPLAEDAVIEALRSRQFNCYSSTVGIPPARKAVADHLSQHLPYKLSSDDVFLTTGCAQSIETILSALACPLANILLPNPNYPNYKAICAYVGLEIRHFDLLPDEGWEVDLHAVEALADENTMAIVIVNPGNPCGNVYSHQHLQKVAETAEKLGILVIADEVYGHLTFGNNSFVPMGVFANIAPVITLGSISKRWIVPGWRLGWIVTNDAQGILQKSGLVQSITSFLSITSDPATFIQGALPQIMEKTNEEFFSKIINLLRNNAELCYEKIKDIPCLTCPSKPQGSMFVMVKLNLSMLPNIENDVDFCTKLAKEQSLIILPGVAVGMKNWLRITFAAEQSSLEEALERLKAFYQRHAKST